MADKFASSPSGLDSPATMFTALTADDDTDIASRPRALYVGGAGDVVVKDSNSVTTTFKAVPAGTVLPIRPVRLMEASTATDIVGLV